MSNEQQNQPELSNVCTHCFGEIIKNSLIRQVYNYNNREFSEWFNNNAGAYYPCTPSWFTFKNRVVFKIISLAEFGGLLYTITNNFADAYKDESADISADSANLVWDYKKVVFSILEYLFKDTRITYESNIFITLNCIILDKFMNLANTVISSSCDFIIVEKDYDVFLQIITDTFLSLDNEFHDGTFGTLFIHTPGNNLFTNYVNEYCIKSSSEYVDNKYIEWERNNKL